MSIRNRFGFSLIANISKAIIVFSSGLLVARGLGAEQYGKLMFLLGTFSAVRGLLDMGSSSAFFTFLSQRQRGGRFICWYIAWLITQVALVLITIGLFIPASWIYLIWNGEGRDLVILAFLASFMQSVLWSLMMQIGESQRLTRWVQGVALVVAIVHFLVMALAWWGSWLDVRNVFCVIIFEWLIAAIVITKKLRYSYIINDADTAKSVLNEFWRYCRPLILYSWVSFAYAFADSWLLQNYGGNSQQAYYSIAYQFGAIAAISTSSILNIFWKEVAEAHHQNDLLRVAILYRRVTRGLYFLAATVAGFLVPWAEDILRITLGSEFVEGTGALIIMLFYPLHQSIGQISGCMAYATGRVTAYVKLGILILVLSMIMSYFMLANANAPIPGLDLGAQGLAVKMVVMQIISVNALAYYLSRSLKVRFDWIFQVATSFVCTSAGILSYVVVVGIISNESLLLRFVASGFIYLTLMAVCLYFLPWLADINKEEFNRYIGIRNERK